MSVPGYSRRYNSQINCEFEQKITRFIRCLWDSKHAFAKRAKTKEQHAIASLLSDLECADNGTDMIEVRFDARLKEVSCSQTLLWIVTPITAAIIVFSILLFVVYKRGARTEFMAKLGEHLFQNVDR